MFTSVLPSLATRGCSLFDDNFSKFRKSNIRISNKPTEVLSDKKWQMPKKHRTLSKRLHKQSAVKVLRANFQTDFYFLKGRLTHRKMRYVQTAIMCNKLLMSGGKIRKEQQQNSLKLQTEKLNTVGVTKKIGASQIYFIEPLH